MLVKLRLRPSGFNMVLLFQGSGLRLRMISAYGPSCTRKDRSVYPSFLYPSFLFDSLHPSFAETLAACLPLKIHSGLQLRWA